ncbi:MAG TPA: ABC transporter permease [Usitatibacter sp.]|jgi:ABC-type polysaccharide/polyol phosphate export permease|nr:ABC transporter permease [Usitatibacter sp.]
MPTEAIGFGRPALRRSLAIQRRVLHALLMREVITRFGRDNLGVLWIVAEPMIFTLGVATLWTAVGLQHLSAVPIIAFAITGYSSVLLWRNCATRCSMAIESNKGLLYHRNVRVIDVFLTRILLEVAGATGSFICLTALFTWIQWMPLPLDPLKVVFGWAMLAWFGASLALLIGAGTAYTAIAERLWHPAAYLLFPISGAAFMVEWLPPRFQDAVLMLPMVHGVELLRDGYFGNAVRTHYNVGYMAACCLVLTLLGLYLVREAGRRVEAH